MLVKNYCNYDCEVMSRYVFRIPPHRRDDITGGTSCKARFALHFVPTLHEASPLCSGVFSLGGGMLSLLGWGSVVEVNHNSFCRRLVQESGAIAQDFKQWKADVHSLS
jgi:hypothetical protein